MKRALTVIACASFLIANAASAATFAVAKDRDFIRSAEAIVVATALDSYTRLDDAGAIDTVTIFSVEEVLKGNIGDSLELHEPGGTYKKRTVTIPGVPRFADGDRALLFLIHTTGGWRVLNLAVGRFAFAQGVIGGTYLVRDDSEIAGIESDGTPYRPQQRSAEKFLQFIRDEVAGKAPEENYRVATAVALKSDDSGAGAAFTVNSYLTNYTGGGQGARWNVFPSAVNFKTVNANAAALTATNTAMAAWNNDAATNINYVNAGVDATGTHMGGVADGAADQQNTIVFEVNLTNKYGAPAFTCGGGGYSGTLGIGAVTNDAGTHIGPGGETFNTATEGDVEMNVGLSNCTYMINLGDFGSAVAHELGHTLGLRHSNQDRDSVGACAGPVLDCADTAIMKAFIPSGLNSTLQQWDKTAIAAVYPTPAGTPPAAAPASVSATATTSTNVVVTWALVSGATRYDIERSANNVTFTNVGSTGSGDITTFNDTSAAANTAYLYRVRAANSFGDGPFSTSDLATTIIFTENPPVSGVTIIKAVHLNELRTAVNAVRTLAGQSAAAFTDPTLSSAIKVKAVHITELRTYLTAARSALGLSTAAYTDPTITAGVTTVKGIHLTEIRNNVR